MSEQRWLTREIGIVLHGMPIEDMAAPPESATSTYSRRPLLGLATNATTRTRTFRRSRQRTPSRSPRATRSWMETSALRLLPWTSSSASTGGARRHRGLRGEHDARACGGTPGRRGPARLGRGARQAPPARLPPTPTSGGAPGSGRPARSRPGDSVGRVPCTGSRAARARRRDPGGFARAACG